MEMILEPRGRDEDPEGRTASPASTAALAETVAPAQRFSNTAHLGACGNTLATPRVSAGGLTRGRTMPTSSVQGMLSLQFTTLLGTGNASRPKPTPADQAESLAPRGELNSRSWRVEGRPEHEAHGGGQRPQHPAEGASLPCEVREALNVG